MVEGLFRTVGNKKDIQLILSSYGKGKRLDLSKFGPHTCASALKQYLANLTEPILTNELLTCFMLAIGLFLYFFTLIMRKRNLFYCLCFLFFVLSGKMSIVIFNEIKKKK